MTTRCTAVSDSSGRSLGGHCFRTDWVPSCQASAPPLYPVPPLHPAPRIAYGRHQTPQRSSALSAPISLGSTMRMSPLSTSQSTLTSGSASFALLVTDQKHRKVLDHCIVPSRSLPATSNFTPGRLVGSIIKPFIIHSFSSPAPHILVHLGDQHHGKVSQCTSRNFTFCISSLTQTSSSHPHHFFPPSRPLPRLSASPPINSLPQSDLSSSGCILSEYPMMPASKFTAANVQISGFVRAFLGKFVDMLEYLPRCALVFNPPCLPLQRIALQLPSWATASPSAHSILLRDTRVFDGPPFRPFDLTNSTCVLVLPSQASRPAYPGH
ncbi:hypothetical protein EJ06DRAFT_161305 [Trichodelitschia bisporula]|uniref:Uncharacterized protein n=1 Tax=Trichodelitschia bisporula TaxID=703511 RepID=A0A6G1HM92_9PEZI|nr:hypothetical protein EJ06DRAFT_161305 [Trichodelitschia bisporula]